MKQLISLGLLVMVSLFVQLAHSADTSKIQFSAKVKVSVSAADNINGVISSYINRELRSLGDVEIVDDNPEYEIEVVVLEVTNVSGYKTGAVALSTVAYQHFDNQLLSAWFQPNYKKTGLFMTSGLVYPGNHWVQTGSSENLDSLCKKLVATFDTDILESNRKIYRKYNK